MTINHKFKDACAGCPFETSHVQAMFLFHHVLTLFLVALSVEWRCWRAGVLTRLCHGPADVRPEHF